MNIILIGPPASGKGTQAEKLKVKFNFNYLSTGQMFREIVKQDTELSNDIKSYINVGKLVPDELTIRLVDEYLKKFDDNILLDGFPRNLFQANELDKRINIDYIIEITASKDTIVKRIVDRGVCKNCGKNFVISKTKTNICDACGGEIIKRADDTVEIAESRYNDYLQKTYPIINFYKDRKGYHKIDGEMSADEVFDQICKILEKKIWFI